MSWDLFPTSAKITDLTNTKQDETVIDDDEGPMLSKKNPRIGDQKLAGLAKVHKVYSEKKSIGTNKFNTLLNESIGKDIDLKNKTIFIPEDAHMTELMTKYPDHFDTKTEDGKKFAGAFVRSHIIDVPTDEPLFKGEMDGNEHPIETLNNTRRIKIHPPRIANNDLPKNGAKDTTLITLHGTKVNDKKIIAQAQAKYFYKDPNQKTSFVVINKALIKEEEE